MSRCELTAQAHADLRAIIRYTKKTWGLPQAIRYRQELELALRKLSGSPRIGVARNEIAAGVRSFAAGSHIAFYLSRKGGITVLRLLHRRMDVESAFGKPKATLSPGRRDSGKNR